MCVEIRLYRKVDKQNITGIRTLVHYDYRTKLKWCFNYSSPASKKSSYISNSSVMWSKAKLNP
jgi:hypothetical protein